MFVFGTGTPFAHGSRCLDVLHEGLPGMAGKRKGRAVVRPRTRTPGASSSWLCGAGAGDGFAQSFEETFGVGHAFA